MRAKTVTASAVAASVPIPVDWRATPFQGSFKVIVTGTITYTVEYTLDDILGTGSVTTWFPHPTIAAQTTSKDGSFTTPITAIRVNNSAGTGSTALTWVQAGGSK